jgi:hypothetical protein
MPDVILCANHRLARHLRAEHDAAQMAAGRSTWQPLIALTVGAWLDGLIAEALLSGAVPCTEAPRVLLSETQERLLWEQAIEAHAEAGEDQLFDRAGLAAAAAEANQLCEIWNLRPGAEAGEETQRFLAWRRQQRAVCASRGWFDAARYRAWQIRCLAGGAGRLPANIAFAGFDRYSPQEAELQRVLTERGVAVSELPLGRDAVGAAVSVACADRRAECHAAAAWAAERLAQQPDARLGIVAIDLASVRETLVAALDDALHPEALLAGNAEMPRCYNVSLGLPLARQPVVTLALELLQLCAHGNRRVELARLARERVFQPETVGKPHIQVMGPLEAAGLSFDALWVLGANDDVWPPAPKPNPLLPAELQRRARSTNASAEVQIEFARSVQRRLLHSAAEIIFSWSRGEGDRQLRPSPLLMGLPPRDPPAGIASVIAQQVGTGRIERLDDALAPPLAEGERIAGGTRLLQAQALCPAWAFYQFRLGARPLDKPVEGMDALERGTLLHGVMEAFFAGRTQAELLALNETQRDAAIRAAVAKAFAAFDAKREEKLPARFAAMEQSRLAQLLAQWLPLELARPVPFSVVACEKTEQVDIAGIEIDVRVDRVDQLADGGTLVIDYKTGKPDTKGWEGERLAEPQLPVYATQTALPPVGVMFARVRVAECEFIGWAEDGNLVGGVEAVDWPAATARWHEALTAVATEIRSGVAAVRFKQEKDLEYCGVLPLLRLPEVKAQKGEQ